MNWFEFDDYKQGVNAWIKGQPKGGHGQLRTLAAFVRVNSVVMSQVFRGERDLTMEQAVLVARFAGQTDFERDYFLLLVQKARAGSKELKDVMSRQIESARKQAKTLQSRIKHSTFSDKDRATFYSHWYYSAVRLAASFDDLNSASEIADRLRLPRDLVARVVNFLKAHQLVTEKNGKLDIGHKVTHVGHDSPLVTMHHGNWRMKALQAMDSGNEQNLFYSGPMALSGAAAEAVRNDLIALIERVTKLASESKSEELKCLSLDWFSI